jgi:antitoxin (DNA-binding transcriptional repressor) of toxin-antitoxin stability system
MKTVNVHEAKTNLSGILATIEQDGLTITICRNGEPIADLGPHKKPRLRSRIKPDPTLSRIEINYDPTEGATEKEWPKARR